MYPIVGLMIQIITFPGVIVHELAHQLFCRWCGVPVFAVNYFKIDHPNPLGYVIHERPKRHLHTVLISTGPFFINTVLGFLVAFPAALQYKFNSANPFDYILMYLGVSIAIHAFPSTGDAQSMWESIKGKQSSLLTKIFVTPIVGIIYAGAFGSIFWLDVIYGVAVALGLPWMIVRGIA